MNLTEFKQKYPQYAGVEDEPLTKALHSKFYPDMAFDDFAGRVGYAPQQKDPWFSTLRERVSDAMTTPAGGRLPGGGLSGQDIADEMSDHAESIARVGGALGGGLLAFPAAGIVGYNRWLSEDIQDAARWATGKEYDFSDNMALGGTDLQAVAAAPNELLKTEGERQAIETIMKPMEWVENAGGFYGDAVFKATGNPNLAAAAKTAFEAVSFLGLPGMKNKLIKSARAGKAAELQRATTEAFDMLNEIVAGEKAIRKGQKVEAKIPEARKALLALQAEPKRLGRLAEVERRLLMMRDYKPSKVAAESAAFFADPSTQHQMTAMEMAGLQDQIQGRAARGDYGWPRKSARETAEVFADPKAQQQMAAMEQQMTAMEMAGLQDQIQGRAAQGDYGWPRKSARETAEVFADPAAQQQMTAMEMAGLQDQIQGRAAQGDYGWPAKDVRESAGFFADTKTQMDMMAREIEGLKQQIAERDASGEYAELIRKAEDQQLIDQAPEYGSQPRQLRIGEGGVAPATFTDPVRPTRPPVEQTPAEPSPKTPGVPAEPPLTGNLPGRGLGTKTGEGVNPSPTEVVGPAPPVSPSPRRGGLVPDRGVNPQPGAARQGPTSIGGAIREFTGGKGISRQGVRHRSGSDVFKDLPRDAQMQIKNQGVSLDLVEEYLISEGYLHPGQDLIEMMRQEPGAMGYGKVTREGERAANQRLRPEEERLANEPEYPPEWDEIRTDEDIQNLKPEHRAEVPGPEPESAQSITEWFEDQANMAEAERAMREEAATPAPSPRRGGVDPQPEAPQKTFIEQIEERRAENTPEVAEAPTWIDRVRERRETNQAEIEKQAIEQRLIEKASGPSGNAMTQTARRLLTERGLDLPEMAPPAPKSKPKSKRRMESLTYQFRYSVRDPYRPYTAKSHYEYKGHKIVKTIANSYAIVGDNGKFVAETGGLKGVEKIIDTNGESHLMPEKVRPYFHKKSNARQERLIEKAKGHKDLDATQAARRLLEKKSDKSWIEQIEERRAANRPESEAITPEPAPKKTPADAMREAEKTEPVTADAADFGETAVNLPDATETGSGVNPAPTLEGFGAKDLLKSESGAVKIDLRNAKDRHLQSIAKDEVLKKIHGMIGDNKKPSTMGDFWVGGMEKMVDRFDALGREKGKALNPIDKMGLPTSEAHKAALRYNSYRDVTAMKFNELAKVIPKSVRREPLIFSDYVNAHRAMTRAERNLKNPNKVTFDDAQAGIAKWEKKWTDAGRPLKELKDGYKAFQQWADKNILRDLVDAGVLSKERYDAIKANNEHYAAFDVLDHAPDNLNEIPASLPSKEYFSLANQDIIKTMTGTEKRIADPMEATFRKFMRAQELAARNKVASALIDDPGMAGQFRRVAKSKKEFGILRNQKQNPMMDSQVNKKTHEIINRFEDGRVESYAVPKEIAEAMKQLSPAEVPRVLHAVNNAFRKSATTLYLPFTISNAMRDFLMAYSTSPTYKTHQLGNYILDWNKGLWEGVKHEFGSKSNIAEQYVKDGGGFGYSGELRTAQGAKQGVFSEPSLKAAGATLIKSVPDLIEKASGAVELAPRLAVYERAKRMGASGEDAALLARRSTVDFNQAGTAMRVYNQWVPFLNARVQGKLNLARALRRDPKGTLSKVAMTVALPGVATYAWNRLNFGELYDDIPEYIKQNYFVIVTGTGTDAKGKTAPKYHVISKGDTGQMAWNPIEYMLDRMYKKDREGVTKFLTNFLSDVSPVEFARDGEVSASKALSSMLPPPAKAVIEPATNYSLYQGREVVPQYMERRRPEQRYFDKTPAAYKKAGEVLGVAPLKIQNVMSNLFAGYGREGLDPKAMWKGLTGRLTKIKGGEHERKAWDDINSLEAEYQYARSDAAEAVAAGDRKGALKVMRAWNAEAGARIGEYNKRFSKYGLADKGGLRKNMFTYKKIMNVLKRRDDPRDPIQRRLSVR